LAHELQGLGQAVGAIPQNCTMPDQCSAHCSMGCKSGGKRDSVRAWLATAARSSGVTMLTKACALRIVTQRVSAKDGASALRDTRACGVIVELVCFCIMS
jgi:choline dehydrogenase-like flavoprotein